MQVVLRDAEDLRLVERAQGDLRCLPSARRAKRTLNPSIFGPLALELRGVWQVSGAIVPHILPISLAIFSESV